MSRWAAAAGLLIAGIGLYYYFFYPPTLYKRYTRQALQQFSMAVTSKDRAKIGNALQQLLADDAKIRLDIGFFSISQPGGGQETAQEFDKAGFISFIDNTLYSLQDYGFEARLNALTLDASRQEASIAFTPVFWADGLSYYGGTGIAMRFSAEADCTGQAAFSGKQARLRQADCAIALRMVPKPEEAAKLRDPAMLEQLLK